MNEYSIDYNELLVPVYISYCGILLENHIFHLQSKYMCAEMVEFSNCFYSGRGSRFLATVESIAYCRQWILREGLLYI